MLITTCRPDELPALLPEALAGRAVLAPVAEPSVLAMLRPEVPVAEPGAAVVVATSGSSGQPKGVVLSRTALLAAADAAQQRLGRLTWTNVLPVQHVAGLMVLVRAQLAGTAVRQASAQLTDLDPQPGLANAISIVPTQLHRAMHDAAVHAALRRYQVILLGGAAVDPGLLALARSSGLALVTTYGMSETCGGCVWDGEPLPGVRVSIGDRGRITLAGPMVFSGYRLQPELTAEVLRGDTVVTNDRGRLADGRLQVLGRLDEVVVSGGVNVDLAGVQAAVDALGQGEFAVVGLPDAEWGHRVTLVAERASGGGTGSADLAWWRSELRKELGAAALPARLEWLDVLPRTGSGKIDRRAIVAQLESRGERPERGTDR